MSIESNELGEKIRFARVTASLTQQDVADKIGIARNYLSDIERGKNKPSYDLLKRLEERLPGIALPTIKMHERYKLPVETKDIQGAIDDWDTVRGVAILEGLQLIEKLDTEGVVALVMYLRDKTGYKARNVYDVDSVTRTGSAVLSEAK